MFQGLFRLAGIPFLLFICYKIALLLVPIVIFTLGIFVILWIGGILIKICSYIIPSSLTDCVARILNKRIGPDRPGQCLNGGIILVVPIILITPFITIEYCLLIGRISKVVVGLLGG